MLNRFYDHYHLLKRDVFSPIFKLSDLKCLISAMYLVNKRYLKNQNRKKNVQSPLIVLRTEQHVSKMSFKTPMHVNGWPCIESSITQITT